jgi:hypothetical protein
VHIFGDGEGWITSGSQRVPEGRVGGMHVSTVVDPGHGPKVQHGGQRYHRLPCEVFLPRRPRRTRWPRATLPNRGREDRPRRVQSLPQHPANLENSSRP